MISTEVDRAAQYSKRAGAERRRVRKSHRAARRAVGHPKSAHRSAAFDRAEIQLATHHRLLAWIRAAGSRVNVPEHVSSAGGAIGSPQFGARRWFRCLE